MVLITNRQSNILQDIDSLHLFAQVVTSICKSLDEREILKNAFELLSAFDELVTLGYRENLSITQIKTFLEMESHEERIQEIISRVWNPFLSHSVYYCSFFMRYHRTKSSKQLRSENGKQSSSNSSERRWPAVDEVPYHERLLTPPTRPHHGRLSPILTIAMSPRKKRALSTSLFGDYATQPANKCGRSISAKGRGMQLGKKSKTTDMFERVREDLGPEAEESAPLVPTPQPSSTADRASHARTSSSLDRDSIHVTIAETITAKLSREGSLKLFEVKGDLQLRISDPSLTRVKLDVVANATSGAQFLTHPNVDKGLFTNSKMIQLKDSSKGFPANNSVGVLRWKASAKDDTNDVLPITFTVWVNKGSDDSYTVTVEYELTGGDTLKDVTVTIPYATSEPAVSSFDAVYEVSGDSLDWTIGTVDEENPTGSFEFEAQADDDAEFFPMSVRFTKSKPFVDVDVRKSDCCNIPLSMSLLIFDAQVSLVTLLDMDQEVPFSKEVKSTVKSYLIE